MLALQLTDFMIELKDGAIKNVGPADKAASAKLFDVETVEARAFGDKRLKFVFEDDEGNEVQVALFPDQARTIKAGIESLEDEGIVFE